MMHLRLTAIYLACLSLMVVVGFSYDAVSSGLAAPTSDGPFFCKELLSSGGNDDATIFAFSLFFLPLGLRIIRYTKSILRYELIGFSGCWLVTILALWLASLDCASIVYTAFVLPDPLLASALLALLVSTISLVALCLRQRPLRPE